MEFSAFPRGGGLRTLFPCTERRATNRSAVRTSLGGSAFPAAGALLPWNGNESRACVGKYSPEWAIVDGRRLEREIVLKDFREALALANRIGEIAEGQNHHPDLLVSWGKLHITQYTHAVDGLHENDFILAARIDALLRPEQPGESD